MWTTLRPIIDKTFVARATSWLGLPSMKVRVPAEAPTTPPDIGASMKIPSPLATIESATDTLVAGSMVDVSINSRSTSNEGRGPGLNIDSYTDLTSGGLGRAETVIA